ncbi:hypothetical protein PH189_22535 [Actinomycetospora chibensis]|nr:hypothetical protein [Actinomycetospora chibensis]MDD7926356.1 hypothetical protein [Actinomycetospora chibensis]
MLQLLVDGLDVRLGPAVQDADGRGRAQEVGDPMIGVRQGPGCTTEQVEATDDLGVPCHRLGMGSAEALGPCQAGGRRPAVHVVVEIGGTHRSARTDGVEAGAFLDQDLQVLEVLAAAVGGGDGDQPALLVDQQHAGRVDVEQFDAGRRERVQQVGDVEGVAQGVGEGDDDLGDELVPRGPHGGSNGPGEQAREGRRARRRSSGDHRRPIPTRGPPRGLRTRDEAVGDLGQPLVTVEDGPGALGRARAGR